MFEAENRENIANRKGKIVESALKSEPVRDDLRQQLLDHKASILNMANVKQLLYTVTIYRADSYCIEKVLYLREQILGNYDNSQPHHQEAGVLLNWYTVDSCYTTDSWAYTTDIRNTT